jgi:hypothetical protein
MVNLDKGSDAANRISPKKYKSEEGMYVRIFFNQRICISQT